MRKIINNKLILIIPLTILIIISFFSMQNAKLLSGLYKFNLIKQILWVAIGIVFIFIIKRINNNIFYKYAKYLYIISCIFLILVLFLGKTTNGAKAWLSLGAFSFQPSEIMKLALSLYLSSITANYHDYSLKGEIKFIFKILILTVIPSILVFLEPDTGAIIFFLLIDLACFLSVPLHKFWYIAIGVIGILLVGTFTFFYIYHQDLLIKLIGTSFFYRVERLIAFKTESSYQLENALIAMGSAGLFGSGINKISLYIPEAPTDFIFAFSISNFGIMTGFLIILCYLFIDIYLINKLFNLKDKKNKFFLTTFLFIFIFSQIMNIGMNLGLLPIMGIPLPFLSYGGSSLIIYFIYLGIIMSHLDKNSF